MNDLSPQEYDAIEWVSPGWHRVGDLPPFVRFKSHAHSELEWIVCGEKEDGRIVVRAMCEEMRAADCTPGMTVLVS